MQYSSEIQTYTIITITFPGQHKQQLSLGLIIGGQLFESDGGKQVPGPETATVAVFGGDCTVADLPHPRRNHVSLVTPGKNPRVLVCGGTAPDLYNPLRLLDSCLSYNLSDRQWIHHSTTLEPYAWAAGVSLSGGSNPGSYIFKRSGGEFLPQDSSVWQKGPEFPGGYTTARPCVVATTHTTLLIFGVHGVFEYNAELEVWDNWKTSLLMGGRFGHACHLQGRKVVVAGGSSSRSAGITTELLDLDSREMRRAGDLTSDNYGSGMFQMGIPNREILIVFGGSNNSLLEQWDPEVETWTPSPAIMARKYLFSATTVDASLVCKPGNEDILKRQAQFQPISFR